jgi:hypothetical protein
MPAGGTMVGVQCKLRAVGGDKIGKGLALAGSAAWLAAPPAAFYAGHTLWHQSDAAGSIGAAGG